MIEILWKCIMIEITIYDKESKYLLTSYQKDSWVYFICFEDELIKYFNFNCIIIQKMNYKHNYHRPHNPLQNYFPNTPLDAKNTQIKK